MKKVDLRVENRLIQGKFLIPFTILLVTNGLIFAFLYHYIFHIPLLRNIILTCTFAGAFTPVVAKYFDKSLVASNYLNFFFFVAVLGTSFFTDGLNSPSTPWIISLVVLPSFLCSVKSSLVWALIVLVSLIVQEYLISLYGIENLFEGLDLSAITLFNIAGSLSVTSFVLNYSIIKKNSLELERIRNLKEIKNLETLKEKTLLAIELADKINNPLTIIGLTMKKIEAKPEEARMADLVNIVNDCVTQSAAIIHELKNNALMAEKEHKSKNNS